MLLYPAIDLLDGTCVRLERGDVARKTSYGDPLAVAERLVRSGAQRLHVVDLDAARTGSRENASVVEAIADQAGVPVQAGGGVRTPEVAEELLSCGVSRVVVGTAALESPEMVRDLAREHPGAIAVGLDHRSGELAARGWEDGTGVDLMAALGSIDGSVAAVVVTDISRDGMLAGPDLDGIREVLAATELEVVASGGVASVEDIRALGRISARGRHVAGVIVGRAILDGAVDVEEALEACAASG